MANALTSMVSSRIRLRKRGAMALPTIATSAETPTTAANHRAPWSCSRSQNARWKKVKPTQARSTVIVIAPFWRLPDLSCTDSSLSTAWAAITSGGKRVALRNAPTKMSAP